MNNISTYIIFGMVIALVIWVYRIWWKSIQDDDWKPDKLMPSRLILVEQVLRTTKPWRISGKPDRVYRLTDGLHVPVEFKNRDYYRIYDTDVAQLSLQAWLLRCNGLPTARIGYVVIKNRLSHTTKALKVTLKDDIYCEHIITRYIELIEHRDIPRKSIGPRCVTCGHRENC